VVLSYLDFF